MTSKPPNPPVIGRPPAAIEGDQQCAALPALRAAYYGLLAGAQTQQVRDGDRWQTFHPGNARELKVEIRRLEILCDPRQARRAVRVGPHNGPYGGHGWPFGRNWPY